MMTEDRQPPESTVGLLPIVGALETLFEQVKVLPSPIPSKEGVPLVNAARVLGVLALQRLTEDQGTVLQRLLHPEFFRIDEKHDYPSWAARRGITVLLGFLRGCIAQEQQEAQQQANAEAYAAAKLKEERGIGFTRPDS